MNEYVLTNADNSGCTLVYDTLYVQHFVEKVLYRLPGHISSIIYYVQIYDSKLLMFAIE